MKLLTDRYQNLESRACFLIVMVFTITGCASTAPGPTFVQKTVQISTALEEKGDIVDAVEELKIALTVDPKNTKVQESLARLLTKRDQQAEKHLRTGIALRNSNPAEARKEFLRALRIRNDYSEALTALRELQLNSSKALIQNRIKKEAKAAASKAAAQEKEAEEDTSTGDYSLDIAISALEDGDFSTAISEFEKIRAVYPNDPDIKEYLDKSWFNYGKASYIKMEYKKALSSFTKVRKGYENVDDYIAKCKQALKKAGTRK